jgi:hypothetical protein
MHTKTQTDKWVRLPPNALCTLVSLSGYEQSPGAMRIVLTQPATATKPYNLGL